MIRCRGNEGDWKKLSFVLWLALYARTLMQHANYVRQNRKSETTCFSLATSPGRSGKRPEADMYNLETETVERMEPMKGEGFMRYTLSVLVLCSIHDMAAE